MLTSGLRESSQDDPIEIQTVDPRAAELLIKYIYCGEIQLDDQVFKSHTYFTSDKQCQPDLPTEPPSRLSH